MALNGSDNDSLVPLVAVSHPVSLPANVGFVHFHNSLQKISADFAHRGTNTVAEIPRCFVGDFDRSTNLISRNSFFGFDHQVDRQKPFPERQVRIVEDRTASDRKLITALVAIVLVALRDCRNAFRFAARTLNAIRPFQFDHIRATLFICTETLNQVDQVYV